MPSLSDLIPSLAPYLNDPEPESMESPASPNTRSESQGVSPSDPLSLRSGERGQGDRGAPRENAFKHGLRATDEIFLARLGERERLAYKKIRRALGRFYEPETALEDLLVDKMAIQHLRMLRLYEVESIAMDHVPLHKFGPMYVIPHLDRLARYDVRIEKQLRILHNRYHALTEMRERSRLNLMTPNE